MRFESSRVRADPSHSQSPYRWYPRALLAAGPSYPELFGQCHLLSLDSAFLQALQFVSGLLFWEQGRSSERIEQALLQAVEFTSDRLISASPLSPRISQSYPILLKIDCSENFMLHTSSLVLVVLMSF